MNPQIFRAYDIRGVADRDLPDDVARRIGRGIGLLASDRTGKREPDHGPVLAVGRDARLSSRRIRNALVAGLQSVGVRVVDVGICATPMVYFAAHTFGVDGGVMVTGSHNPAPDNGVKVTLCGSSLHGEDIQTIRRLADSVAPETRFGSISERDVHAPYVDWIAENISVSSSRTLRVVVDAGNGPTGPVAPGLLRRLGCEVIELFCEPDGRFPNHHPDPTVAENLVDLQAAVALHGADLGVAYDGDGDRIGVVDEQGGILWGDRLMVILSRALLRDVPGAAIVAEVKCSQTLFDDIAARGGRAVMSRVGHSLIKDRMKQEDAALAGEMSGHIFYKHRYFGYDDAMYTTCRLLEILAATDAPLSSLLVDLPLMHATPELRLHCPDESKFHVVATVTEQFRGTHDVIDIDGVRVRFPDGWGLVRASNTGPILVLRCEATTAAGRDRIRAELTAAVERVQGMSVAQGVRS
ncbi:MAG: phosphomannomutase/phosphoglucomutase [Myxococcales bacterium]|nr:phosphomannomutase/phosphoglucomutase [Myxococcales bacterium]